MKRAAKIILTALQLIKRFLYFMASTLALVAWTFLSYKGISMANSHEIEYSMLGILTIGGAIVLKIALIFLKKLLFPTRKFKAAVVHD